jgi:hypothetical protein
MRFRVFMMLLMAAVTTASGQKKNDKKAPEIELMEATAHRQDGNITIDGKVRNCGEKPIKKLVLLFDFMDGNQQVLTTRKDSTEQEVLAPGEEAEFHSQVPEPPRATHFQINFEDGGGKYLRVVKNGPFAIE